MTSATVTFLTHATPTTGFGHAARCATLARLVKDRMPAAVTSFAGEFEASAEDTLRAIGPIDAVYAQPPRSDVGVYDRMDDVENPEIVDEIRLDGLTQRCRTVFLFANGHTAPRRPGPAIVIGYKPAVVQPSPPRLHWGLQYAPVARDLLAKREVRREARRAFVALGGAVGDSGLRKVLAALGLTPQVADIDILNSPVNPIAMETDGLRWGQTVAWHRGVANVGPFLAGAGLVVASYGHLAYEALACGAPLCIVGHKTFQASYGARLAESGLAVSAGLLSEASAEDLAGRFDETLRRAADLSAAGSAAVDGRGLDRIADMIVAELAMQA